MKVAISFLVGVGGVSEEVETLGEAPPPFNDLATSKDSQILTNNFPIL